MIPIADSYFAALERADGTRYVPFADSCNRMENGVQTTNNSELGAGMGGGYNIMAMSCTEQFKTGYFKFVTEIRRRHVLADEERGMVFSFAALDHAGNIKQVTTSEMEAMALSVDDSAKIKTRLAFSAAKSICSAVLFEEAANLFSVVVV